MLARTYQYLEVDGEPFTTTAEERRGSRFWNEGKWENFIEPLLPEYSTRQTFVEMGCDAGLFLKMAKDRGYRSVIGVEKNKTPYCAALSYRDAIGYDYQIIKRTLGNNFDIDELPVADVTLMSTFHYHVGINAWHKYLDRIAAKSCYCLIVSSPSRAGRRWRVNSKHRDLKQYFAGWEEVGLIDNIPTEGDPKPRRLFSVLFRSPTIRRVPIDAIVQRREVPKVPDGTDGIRKLTEQVMSGGEFDLTQTAFYADWKKRKPRWSEKSLMRFVRNKHELVKSFVEDGPRDPILVKRGTLQLCDGSHRLPILQAMGYKSVIVREI